MNKENNVGNWVICPECKIKLKQSHIKTHMQNVHNKIFDESSETLIQATMPKKRKNQRPIKKSKSKMTIGIILIIIALICAGYFYFGNNGRPEKGTGIEEAGGIIGEAAYQNPVGDKTIAPNFSFTDATGKTMSLQDFKGKVVILQFMQILSDCHGGYFYKIDDRAPYDSSKKNYVKLTGITTIHQFDELKKIYNNYSSDDVAIITVIIPPGCCGDPLKFSQDIKNQFDLDWYVSSDNKQYDTWYKYTEFLPYDTNHVLTSDPAILVLDKNDQYVVYHSGYTDAATLGGI